MEHGKYVLEQTWQGWIAKIRKADAQPLLKRSFPGYRGMKYKVIFCKSVTFHDVNWSGGSKNDYVIIRTSDGQAREIDDSRPPWDQPLEGHTQELTPAFIVCEHTMFCGKDLGVRFYMAEALLGEWQAPAEISAPAAQLESPSVY